MSSLLGGEKCFLNYGSWRGGLLWDDFVGAEDIVPLITFSLGIEWS